MKKRVVIVANGRLWKDIPNEISAGDIVIGVDKAAYWLLKHGIIPDIAIGDFDSVNDREFAFIKKHIAHIHTYSSEKDFIDTELALEEALQENPQEILIIGASGTRRDHELAVIGLLETCIKHGVHAIIRDETNDILMVGRGRTILNRRKGREYISILPITSSIIISLSKFKYKIEKKRIVRGQTIGISNEFTSSSAVVDIHRGKALVIQSQD
jgi:thiamine pyrophosphokinase